MSSYLCPRCHTKSPVQLRANQVCKGCQSADAWARLGRGNQVIVIHAEVEAGTASVAPSEFQQVRASRITWVFLILSLVLTISTFPLFIHFFKQPSATLPPHQLLNKFYYLATSAFILGGLSVLASTGIVHYAREKEYHGKPLVRMAGLAVIVLAVGSLGLGFSCWSRTEKIRTLPPMQPATTATLSQRIQSATTVVQALDARTDRYRSAKGAGVIIGTKSGHTWILTVPYANNSSWRDLPAANAVWVDFSDGRSFSGRIRWAAKPPINLALIEVSTEAPGVTIPFHPIAEGIIPSEAVLFAPNPLLSGWALEPGTILKRRGVRTKTGWSCLVDVDLPQQLENMGGGLYDQEGRLLGLEVGFDRQSETAQFLIVTSDMVRSMMAANESGSLDALEALSPEARIQ